MTSKQAIINAEWNKKKGKKLTSQKMEGGVNLSHQSLVKSVYFIIKANIAMRTWVIFWLTTKDVHIWHFKSLLRPARGRIWTRISTAPSCHRLKWCWGRRSASRRSPARRRRWRTRKKEPCLIFFRFSDYICKWIYYRLLYLDLMVWPKLQGFH